MFWCPYLVQPVANGVTQLDWPLGPVTGGEELPSYLSCGYKNLRGSVL